MKIIPLTKGKSAIVDDELFEELSKYKWCTDIKNSYGKPYFYAVRNTYELGKWKPRKTYMHRLIVGAKKSKYRVVDHKNGNTLDNRRSNLRYVSRAVNLKNRILA